MKSHILGAVKESMEADAYLVGERVPDLKHRQETETLRIQFSFYTLEGTCSKDDLEEGVTEDISNLYSKTLTIFQYL